MSGLDRLAKLYARVERARLVEARAAAVLCDEVRLARGEAVQDVWAQNDAMREALIAGDPETRTVAEAIRNTGIVQAERLMALQREREVQADVAEATHRESRVQSDQLDRVVERARGRAALEEARKAQAAADDRYGSRLKWMRARMEDERPLM